MSQKLKDTNLPAHAIVEVREDGSALRNDGMELGAANKNPWYVLATVFGEQAEDVHPMNYDTVLAARNRRAWNGWFCDGLSEEERKGLAEKTGLDIDELKPLSSAELQEITKLFQLRLESGAELPDKTEPTNFREVIFSKYFCAGQFVFVRAAFFDHSTFSETADFRSSIFSEDAFFGLSTFSGGAYFHSPTFSGNADFSSSVFIGTAYFRSSTFSRATYFGFSEFDGDTHFGSSEFIGVADFSSSTFSVDANFKYSEFKSTTRFNQARFLTAVPEFHEAKLYDDTTFTLPDDCRDNWPPLEGVVQIEGWKRPVKVMPAEDQKRAYNQLRLFMNQTLQIEQEQFFHRQELRCKMVMAK